MKAVKRKCPLPNKKPNFSNDCIGVNENSTSQGMSVENSRRPRNHAKWWWKQLFVPMVFVNNGKTQVDSTVEMPSPSDLKHRRA
jgi:hypothetical protein